MPRLSKKETIICPVCDTKIPGDSDECPECGLDRIIIELEETEDDDFGDLDNLMQGIEENIDGIDDDEIVESMFDSMKEAGAAEEIDDEEFEAELDALEKELGFEDEEAFVFECPVCGSEVGEELNECPVCGAIFEEDSDILEVDIKEIPAKEEDFLKEIEQLEADEITVPTVEEDIDKEKEYEEVITDAKEELISLRDIPISEDVVRQHIREATQAKNKGDIDTAIRLGIEAIEVSEKLKEFVDNTQTLKAEIFKLKKNKIPHNEFISEINVAKKSVEHGFFKKGFSKMGDVEKDIRKKFEDHESQKEKKRDLDVVVSELNELLQIAKEMGLTLKDERQMISQALAASRKGDIEKAHYWLSKARDDSFSKLEDHIQKDIKELEIRLMSYDGSKKDEFEDRLLNARKAKVDGSYRKSMEEINIVKKVLQEKSVPSSNKEFEILENLLRSAKAIGIDCSESETLLSEAKTEYELGDKRKSEIKLAKSRDILIRSIPSNIQRAMKEGLNNLDEAKKFGKDISKPVTHLKQANLMVKRRDYLKALKHIGVFFSLMDKILEERDAKQEKPTKQMDLVRTTQQKPKEKTTHTIKKVNTVQKAEKKLPSKLDNACTYLLLEKKSNDAFSLFKRTMKIGLNGICVTRQYPDKLKSRYGLEEVPIIWLSNIDQKNAYKPKNLEKLSLELELFLAEGSGVILLEGLEYLISNNDFRTVFHLIQSLKDLVAVTDSILILSASPLTLEKNQIELLEKEVDDTFRL